MKIKWEFIVIVALLLLIGCSPAAKLKRAEKLIKKAEEMGAQWHVDTVYHSIVIPTKPIFVVDTVRAVLHDTVRIEKERLKIKLVRLPGDSIFVEGECEADTIKVEVPVTVTKTIKAKGYSLWQLIILALVMLLAGYGVRAFMRR